MVNFKKWLKKILKREINFLGHIVSDSGVRADPGKVEAITNMPQPETINQLRSFFSSMIFLQQHA